jgi:hypothetical protein
MPQPRAILCLAAVAGGLVLAGCGSGGADQPTPAQIGGTLAATPPGLPFHHQATGQSSSPSFRVATAGTYRVDYVIKGSADLPGCIVSISLVADGGSAQQVVSGEKLQPTDTRQNSVQVTLKSGSWRFQEAGGCSWDVTVGPA